jgi:D-3-phosphoglycerate dehydrogenase
MDGCVGVIAGTEKYNRNVLSNCEKLKIISRVGVGTDNIDFLEAEKSDIKICRTETDLSKAVAELAFGLIMDVSRKISFHDQSTKSGVWKKKIGHLVSGKTLGILGLGKIGKALIELTCGFGMRYLAYDQFPDNNFAEKYDVDYVELDQLLSNSDIVSIHMKYDASLLNFLSDGQLSLLKKEAILINTSRGEFIDESALYRCLSENRVFGAGLDVYHDEPYKGELSQLENCVLTPHNGSFVKEIRLKMELEAVENLVNQIKQI